MRQMIWKMHVSWRPGSWIDAFTHGQQSPPCFSTLPTSHGDKPPPPAGREAESQPAALQNVVEYIPLVPLLVVVGTCMATTELVHATISSPLTNSTVITARGPEIDIDLVFF